MIERGADVPIDARLADLHDSYTWRANAAASAERDDLAADLAQEFLDAALDVLLRPQQ